METISLNFKNHFIFSKDFKLISTTTSIRQGRQKIEVFILLSRVKSIFWSQMEKIFLKIFQNGRAKRGDIYVVKTSIF